MDHMIGCQIRGRGGRGQTHSTILPSSFCMTCKTLVNEGSGKSCSRSPCWCPLRWQRSPSTQHVGLANHSSRAWRVYTGRREVKHAYHRERMRVDPMIAHTHADTLRPSHRPPAVRRKHQIHGWVIESKCQRRTSASSHIWRLCGSSSNSPMPSRHPLTIAATQPVTSRTIFGLPSLKLTMNSSAALRTSSFSAYEASSMEPFLSGGDAGDGGKVNVP